MLATVVFYFCNCLFVLFLIHYLLRSWLHYQFTHLHLWQCYTISARLISGILATIISVVSLRTLYINENLLYQRDPWLENLTLILSGYFAYDIIVMYNGYALKLKHNTSKDYSSKVILLKFLRQEIFMVIHHLILLFVGLPAVTILMYKKNGLGTFFIAGIFFAECSTPFYSTRGILKNIGCTSGKLYEINGLLFLITFFVSRICTMPYLYYRYALFKNISFASVPLNIPIHCNIASFAFWFLQLYWFVLIIKVVISYTALNDTKSNGTLQNGGNVLSNGPYSVAKAE